MKFLNIIPLQDASSGTITGTYADLGDLTDYSVTVYFTGGASNLVGTLTLEASDEPTKGFIKITGSDQAVSASANNKWNVTGSGYRYVRAKWVYTSGTGNIEASIYIKEKVIKGA